ncbi:MAG: alanyl-tRNA editing protein [Firmicutes bacterium]|nr:alanyl-tRNA editing protein [Bacillota bacterium]
MTEKLFQIDPYLKQTEAEIVEVSEDTLALDRTIFAPEAGGQASDLGTIDGIDMLHAEEKDGIVYHKMADIPSGFKAGAKVKLELDWETRFDHMQNHCGEHIISGILFTKYGIGNKGFHLGSEFSTLDADMKQMPQEMVDEVERLANKAVFSAVPVTVDMIESKEEAQKLPLRKELKVDEDISIVTIPGIDCVACCCPHPSDTSQVGLIKIIKAENYKGMTRIYFKCGMRAFEDYKLKHDIITVLNKKYSSEEHNLIENIKIQDNKNNEMRRDLYAMKSKFALMEAERLVADSEKVVSFEYDDQSLDDLKFMAKKIMEITDLPVILSSTSCMTVLLTHSGKSKLKCGKLVKEFACGFGGKGGGSDTLAQALFSDVEIMRNFVKISLMSV